MTQKLITMTQKELFRSEIITNLINGIINGTDASKQLDLSVRQIQRLKAKVLTHGIKALAHGNRGKSSNRKIDEQTIIRITNIIKKNYFDFGPTLVHEKL